MDKERIGIFIKLSRAKPKHFPSICAMTEPGADIFEILARELRQHEGVFIGETHQQPFPSLFLASYMQELRTLGVTTIYIELPHECLMALRDGGAFGLARQRYDDSMMVTAAYMEEWNLVTAAARLNGMRVIGYDPVNARRSPGDVTDAAVMEFRDRQGARVIQQTRDEGRYIILGGSAHSRDEGANPAIPAMGLPERLGIPAIDFVPTSDTRGYRILRNTDGLADYTVQHERRYLFPEGWRQEEQREALIRAMLEANDNGLNLRRAGVVQIADTSEQFFKSDEEIAAMLRLIVNDRLANAR
jgi:hypothetical protein